MRVQIRLDTQTDVTEFVNVASKNDGVITITDGNGLRANAKSLLGVLSALEFSQLWCESDVDIYSQIERFVVLE